MFKFKHFYFFANWPALAALNETQLGIVKFGIIRQNIGHLNYSAAYKIRMGEVTAAILNSSIGFYHLALT